MSLFARLEKHLVIGLAAAAAMHVLLEHQQDLTLDIAADTLKKRAKETAAIAVTFANALYAELTA